MTVRCTDLDSFFDGELEADQAAAFRDHLASCPRCQTVLHGRVQEEVAAHGDDAAVAAAAALPAAALAANATAAAEAAPAASASIEPTASGTRRRVMIYLAPILTAAAAMLVLWPRDDDGPLELAVDVEHRGPAARGNVHVGDELHSTVRGERHRAIWVYLDDRDLMAACPNDQRCRETGSVLELRLPLDARGRYTVVALGSDNAIPPPAAGKSVDELLATLAAGVHSALRTIDVD
jgi:hypothetical protein